MPTRILADENVHKRLVLELRAVGFDVLWIAESEKRTMIDSEIARLANKDNRVLLTCDSDFIKNPAVSKVVQTKLIYVKNKITKHNAGGVAEEVREILDAKGKMFIIDPDSLLGFGRAVEF